MPSKRSRWNQQPVPPSDKVCDSLMIVAPKRWQLAEAIIAAIYVASEELKGGPPADLYVRDDGWGNALILREPVPEQFVLALLAAMPQAELVPVDYGLCPARPLMTIGRHGVTMHTDPIVPGFAEPHRDSDRWHDFAERWDVDSAMPRFYQYRRQRKAKQAALPPPTPEPRPAEQPSLPLPRPSATH